MEDEPHIKKPPIKLYIALIIFAFISIGIIAGSYLGSKIPAKEEPKQAAYAGMDNVQHANAIWGLATIIFSVMLIIFIVSKITAKKT